MVYGTSEVPSPDGGEGEDGVAAGVVPVGEGACRRVSGANTRQRPGRLQRVAVASRGSAFRQQLEPLSFGQVAWRNYLKVPAVKSGDLMEVQPLGE
jgi:hypothetical protein